MYHFFTPKLKTFSDYFNDWITQFKSMYFAFWTSFYGLCNCYVLCHNFNNMSPQENLNLQNLFICVSFYFLLKQVHLQSLSGFDRGRQKWDWTFFISWDDSQLVSPQSITLFMGLSAPSCPAAFMSGIKMMSVTLKKPRRQSWRKSMLVILPQKNKFWPALARVNLLSIADEEPEGQKKPRT